MASTCDDYVLYIEELKDKNKRLQQELEIASLNHKAGRRTRRRLQQELEHWKKAYCQAENESARFQEELQALKGTGGLDCPSCEFRLSRTNTQYRGIIISAYVCNNCGEVYLECPDCNYPMYKRRITPAYDKNGVLHDGKSSPAHECPNCGRVE